MVSCTHPGLVEVQAGHVGWLPPVPECEHPECVAAYVGVQVVELDAAPWDPEARVANLKDDLERAARRVGIHWPDA